MHAVRAVEGPGTYRAGLDIQHADAPGGARTSDTIQEKGEQGGERSRRVAQLSGAPGRRHSVVSRRAGAGRRRSGAAPGAIAGDLAEMERSLRSAAGDRGGWRASARLFPGTETAPD